MSQVINLIHVFIVAAALALILLSGTAQAQSSDFPPSCGLFAAIRSRA